MHGVAKLASPCKASIENEGLHFNLAITLIDPFDTCHTFSL